MPQVSGSSLSQDQRKQKFLPTVICGHKSINPNLSSRLLLIITLFTIRTSSFRQQPLPCSQHCHGSARVCQETDRQAVRAVPPGEPHRPHHARPWRVCAHSLPHTAGSLSSAQRADRVGHDQFYQIFLKNDSIFSNYIKPTPVRLPSERDLKFSGKFFSEQPNVK